MLFGFVPARGPEPTTCNWCDRAATRKVGKVGACAKHVEMLKPELLAQSAKAECDSRQRYEYAYRDLSRNLTSKRCRGKKRPYPD